MKTKTHFAFRVDIWDHVGDSIVEHVAGVDDFEVAETNLSGAPGAAGRRSHATPAPVIPDFAPPALPWI
jgi:hypothetical protein